jgi:hypothetical protein
VYERKIPSSAAGRDNRQLFLTYTLVLEQIFFYDQILQISSFFTALNRSNIYVSIYEFNYLHQNLTDTNNIRICCLPTQLTRKQPWSNIYSCQICSNSIPRFRKIQPVCCNSGEASKVFRQEPPADDEGLPKQCSTCFSE